MRTARSMKKIEAVFSLNLDITELAISIGSRDRQKFQCSRFDISLLAQTMQKLLITGASGFLGWNLCQLARAQWEVYGTYARQAIDIADVKLQQIDLTDSDLVVAYID
jgi:NADPH:quinone reductase-like Zn-dependent oxidoreductase